MQNNKENMETLTPELLEAKIREHDPRLMALIINVWTLGKFTPDKDHHLQHLFMGCEEGACEIVFLFAKEIPALKDYDETLFHTVFQSMVITKVQNLVKENS